MQRRGGDGFQEHVGESPSEISAKGVTVIPLDVDKKKETKDSQKEKVIAKNLSLKSPLMLKQSNNGCN